MSLLDIAKKRYSVRKYEDKPVEKEKLEKYFCLCSCCTNWVQIYSRLSVSGTGQRAD